MARLLPDAATKEPPQAARRDARHCRSATRGEARNTLRVVASALLPFLLIAVVTAASLAVAGETPTKRKAAAQAAPKDRQRILGKWTATVNGKTFLIPISERTIGSKLLYTLRSGKSPKEIDLQHRSSDPRPRATAAGIYEFRENTLRICFVHSGPRPKKFAADVKRGQFLLVLKRQSDAE